MFSGTKTIKTRNKDVMVMTVYFVHPDYVTYYLMTGKQATQLGSAK